MTEVNPQPTVTVNALSAALSAKIVASASSLPPAYQTIVQTYAPAVVRLATSQGVSNITTLFNQLVGLATSGNVSQLTPYMSVDELNQANTELTPLFQAMASDSYNAKQLASQIMTSVLNAAITVGISALTN